MVLLRNLAVLIVVLLVNVVSCEHKEDPNCISTEGVKICSAPESSELSQDVHDAVLESGHSPSDNAGSSHASEESAVNAKVTDVISNAGTEENSAEHASDTKISNPTATNTSSLTGSDNAAHPRTRSMEESSPVVEGNTSNQGSSAAVDTNTSIQVDSGEAGEGNVSKNENSVVSAVTNTTTRDSSVHDKANVSVQEGSVEIFDANVSKQESSIDVAEANATKQENAVSNATMSENSPGNDEASTRKNADSGEAAKANISKQESSTNVTEANSNKQDKSPVSTEENINIGNNSVVDAKGNALEGISANSSKQSSDILSNTTSETQIPERLVAKNQTLESATEGLSRTESVVAEGQETAGSSETRAQTGVNASSPRKEAISDISSPELVAVAEGIVIASAVLQVATARPPPATILDPAHEVALAEGLEMADAVLQAVKEDEPAVNAIWRATLEAESRMEQDNTPVNEEVLDKGLMAFLVCVMVVLAITGSLSGWVLYTRLRRTPEEDQAQNMYILIDASDPQSNFVDCPLDINDSEGNSYTFPRVQNDMFS